MPRTASLCVVPVLLLALAGAGCDNGAPPPPPVDTSPADEGCPPMFHQEEFPEYRVTIAPEEWSALEDEFLNRAEREEQGLDPKPYHPVVFEHDGETVEDAMIRLRGQSSWWQAIMFDEDPKMQFVIAFNEIDPDGRYEGVRKIVLDMPRTDASFLRQRLALYYLRGAGITAQCANNARLVINGEYYGLYTNMERMDKEFLQRHYGDLDEGNLWEGARYIETNEDDFDWGRLDALWMAESAADIDALSDLEASVNVWAHEALPPHFDGYYNGRANFFVYDHPTRGFVWIPYDLDSAFDFASPELSPMYPECEGRFPDDRYHWALVMREQQWVEQYRSDLAVAREAYDVAHLQEVVMAWSDQIATAAEDDPKKPFTAEEHRFALDALYAFIPERAVTVDRFLECWESGGDDADGDGYEFCDDCDDGDASIHPGAAEVCDGVDNDCDGAIDDLLAEGGTCP